MNTALDWMHEAHRRLDDAEVLQSGTDMPAPSRRATTLSWRREKGH